MPVASLSDVERAQRVLLYGVTGSGKSTAAARLGAALGLPVHLVDDEVGWLPGWVERPQDEQRALAHQMASAEGWVVDSAYGAWRDVMLERAQVVIALDYSRALTLSRLVRRCVHRLTTRTPVCNGNTESVRQLFSRNSIVRWHFSSFARKRERMRRWEAAPEGVPVLRLTHPRGFDRLVQSLELDNIGVASREAALRHGGIDDLPAPARDDAARFVEF
ncbi:adenylate kinase [Dermacoccus nishinomiyaensis]|uniref:adenylate kinase n=1 Tax=Dermacoccus nishinomiyaensis TaxID=1274 RepID=UPI001F50E363|nr:adenylate kinase [Dermacoccus nishinomiyaensis]MCI0152542.1 adenylate kinase [Dermacoccus nishinomiyaensis]